MRTIIFGVVVSSLATAAIAADERTLPQPAFFGWIEGGGSSISAGNTHAYDASPPGLSSVFIAPVLFEADHAWYGRSEFGLSTAGRLGPIDSISLAGSFRRGSADKRQETAANGEALIAYEGPSGEAAGDLLGATTVRATQKFRLADVQLRLKKNLGSVIASLEPFAARMDREVFAEIPLLVARSADIKGSGWGMQVAVEVQWPVHDRFSLRGRTSVGAYHMNADGRFAIDRTVAPILSRSDSLSKNFTGLRAGAEIGAEWRLTSNLFIGTTVGIDHWSRMPSARLSSGNPFAAVDFIDPPIGINTKSFTEAYAGVRLSFRGP
jgi:hypothetical protein